MARIFLALALTGCVSTLPALPVDHSPPAVTLHAPPPGQGQIVVDAVDAPGARLEEVVAHGTVDTPWRLYYPRSQVTLTRDRCDTLPCTVDAPYGPIELVVKHGDAEQPFKLTVDEKRSFVRVRLPEHEHSAAGVLGWVLACVAIAPIGGGAGLIAVDSQQYALPGGLVLGFGVALAAVGVALGVTHPLYDRPGTLAAWTF